VELTRLLWFSSKKKNPQINYGLSTIDGGQVKMLHFYIKAEQTNYSIKSEENLHFP